MRKQTSKTYAAAYIFFFLLVTVLFTNCIERRVIAAPNVEANGSKNLSFENRVSNEDEKLLSIVNKKLITSFISGHIAQHVRSLDNAVSMQVQRLVSYFRVRSLICVQRADTDKNLTDQLLCKSVPWGHR